MAAAGAPHPVLSVRGYYSADARRRPFLGARVAIPRLEVSAPVEFLVDTGADRTVIHWNDRQLFENARAEPLPADASFPEAMTLSGISDQRIRYGLDEALLSFRSEQGAVLLARLTVGIALDPIPGVPSLLGRDFFARCRLEFDMPTDSLVIVQPSA